jgi:hypothetical protein
MRHVRDVIRLKSAGMPTREIAQLAQLGAGFIYFPGFCIA